MSFTVKAVGVIVMGIFAAELLSTFVHHLNKLFLTSGNMFRQNNGSIVTADAYLGKTIDVKGIVDYFDGAYQIKVFSEKNIQVKNS